MRANELAGVAERVTNKATLLALNAALEATRSGSEAFAAIAEETRRLAEFAREATDTISRLSSEIEYKVGETITAIHATSEDAKSAVASFQPSGTVRPLPTAAVERLLRRARDLKRRLVAEAA
jgi:methyl-accepting chemotaxis protein